VIEDRVAKEQARRKAEQEEEELKAATKVGFRGQRNSRGEGVGLGGYNPTLPNPSN